MKSLLVGTLYGWSRIWGFTRCIFVFDFMQSVSVSVWFVCICSYYFVDHREHVVLFLMKISITYQYKKKKNREIIEYTILEKNTYGQPWLVYWGSIADANPEILGLRLCFYWSMIEKLVNVYFGSTEFIRISWTCLLVIDRIFACLSDWNIFSLFPLKWWALLKVECQTLQFFIKIFLSAISIKHMDLWPNIITLLVGYHDFVFPLITHTCNELFCCWNSFFSMLLHLYLPSSPFLEE